MRPILPCTLLALCLTLPAWAQSGGHDHSSHGSTTTKAAAAAPEMVDGEVRKVDLTAAKVTLKHGPIKNLDMPPMTMVFRVRPPSLLEGVAVGDRVRFVAERIDGNFTVTSLAKAP
jgi:Cu/Ag efflux protein CusF